MCLTPKAGYSTASERSPAGLEISQLVFTGSRYVLVRGYWARSTQSGIEFSAPSSFSFLSETSRQAYMASAYTLVPDR